MRLSDWRKQTSTNTHFRATAATAILKHRRGNDRISYIFVYGRYLGAESLWYIVFTGWKPTLMIWSMVTLPFMLETDILTGASGRSYGYGVMLWVSWWTSCFPNMPDLSSSVNGNVPLNETLGIYISASHVYEITVTRNTFHDEVL